MAFVHGKNSAFLMNAYNLSGYLNNASTTNSVETAETTAFGSSAKTYISGLADSTISAAGMFDGATGAVDDAMTAAVATTSIVTFYPDGSTVGNKTRMASAVLTSYDVTAPVADVVSISSEFQVSGGLKVGVSLQDIGTAVSSTSNGTSVDNSASSTSSTSFPAVAHLHVTANTRNGTIVVKVQHSSDNSTFADLVTFATVSTSTTTSERVAVASGTTINRYIRASYTVGGSTGSATIGVSFAR